MSDLSHIESIVLLKTLLADSVHGKSLLVELYQKHLATCIIRSPLFHHHVRSLLFPLHVRGLYIAMGQYSSFCVSAVVLSLGGDDIEDGVQGREQVE